VPRKYRVEIVPGAEHDIASIHDRIARDKSKAADRWAKRVRQKIRSLAVFRERYEFIPEAFEVGPDFRHLLFGEYRIIYVIEAKRVIVVRVMHAARILLESMLPKA